MSLFWHDYKDIRFSSKKAGEDAILYRLQAQTYARKTSMHKVVLELTERVMEPFWVFSFVERLSAPKSKYEKKRKNPHEKYESEKGLAEDIYEHLQTTKAEPVWRNDRHIALWSRGHHRKLVRFLHDTCWSKKSSAYNPYWDGEFYMAGFENPSDEADGDDIWNRMCSGETHADLYVRYFEGFSYIGIEFQIQNPTFEKEKYIYELVQEICTDHFIDPILENIDPLDCLGYDI